VVGRRVGGDGIQGVKGWRRDRGDTGVGWGQRRGMGARGSTDDVNCCHGSLKMERILVYIVLIDLFPDAH
jgi:hypothetical protein